MNMLWNWIIAFAIMLSGNIFVKVVAVVILLDTFMGVFRAINKRKFNSSFGINGALRKCAMLVSIIFFAIIDMLIGFNLSSLVPKEILGYIGITNIGLCEFFCLLYIMYEAVSILKNMCLIGLPIPPFQKALEKWLHVMTAELDETSAKTKLTNIVVNKEPNDRKE